MHTPGWMDRTASGVATTRSAEPTAGAVSGAESTAVAVAVAATGEPAANGVAVAVAAARAVHLHDHLSGSELQRRRL